MSEQSRRIVGAVLGLVMGLVYGAVTGTINLVVLPGVPLRVNATSLIASTLLSGLGALAAGYITAWPHSAFWGVLLGAVVIATVGALRGILNQASGADVLGAAIVLLTIFLPSAAFALPITGLLRLGVHEFEEALHHSGRPRLFRMGRMWVGAVALAVLVGSFSQFSDTEKAALRQVNNLVRTALAANSDQDVPPALQQIANFHARASQHYTLNQRSSLSADAGIVGSVAVETIEVDVLFDSGLHFTCLVGQGLARPLCSEVEASR